MRFNQAAAASDGGVWVPTAALGRLPANRSKFAAPAASPRQGRISRVTQAGKRLTLIDDDIRRNPREPLLRTAARNVDVPVFARVVATPQVPIY